MCEGFSVFKFWEVTPPYPHADQLAILGGPFSVLIHALQQTRILACILHNFWPYWAALFQCFFMHYSRP